MSNTKRTHPWRIPYTGAPLKSVAHRPILPNRQFRMLPR